MDSVTEQAQEKATWQDLRTLTLRSLHKTLKALCPIHTAQQNSAPHALAALRVQLVNKHRLRKQTEEHPDSQEVNGQLIVVAIGIIFNEGTVSHLLLVVRAVCNLQRVSNCSTIRFNGKACGP